MTVLTNDQRFINVYNVLGKETTMCKVLDQVEKKGVEKGIGMGMDMGKNMGMDIVLKLSNILVSAGRTDDLKRAETDKPFLKELIKELLPEEE